MRRSLLLCFSGLLLLVAVAAAQNESAPSPLKQEALDLQACAATALKGFRPIADTRDQRFHGKVSLDTALCRGGREAAQYRYAPWIDFANYWGTGDLSSLPQGYLSTSAPKFRGVNGALFDLEYQRIELIKFNLFDNTGTYQQYVEGREGVAGPSLKSWPQLRLPPSSPYYAAVGGDGTQVCTGELIRGRNLTGICNDTRNPLMGSTGMPFARNVEFEATFPDLSQDQLARNRHGGRISLLVPDPQLISRKLFTRQQTDGNGCNNGFGSPTFSNSVDCDYQKAPFFNVLAAYWIQFMTHDWFSHMEEGHNASVYMDVGCTTKLVNGVPTPLTPADIEALGCRPGDRVDTTFVASDSTPESFTVGGKQYMARAPKTFSNNNTAW